MLDRSKIEKENLAKVANFSIDVVVKDTYTYTVQISHLTTQEVYLTIPFDPTDRTVAGSFNENDLQKFGEDAGEVIETLSKVLPEKLGAKEIFYIPASSNLPGFISPDKNAEFKRLFFSECQKLQETTDKILKQQQFELREELDTNYHFVTTEEELLADRDPYNRYQEIDRILENADFTPGKIAEYQNETLSGKMCRFKSENITPIVMLDKKGNIVAIVRSLSMGNEVVYLSDEVIKQDIVPLEKFDYSNDSEEKKKKSRQIFLLAYLMNKVSELVLQNIKRVFIIAASGREDIYKTAGFKGFPINSNFKLVMKFEKPGLVLEKIQKDIKKLPIPEAKSNHWQYGKYIGFGIAGAFVGFFAYKILKKGDAPFVNTLPKLR